MKSFKKYPLLASDKMCIILARMMQATQICKHFILDSRMQQVWGAGACQSMVRHICACTVSNIPSMQTLRSGKTSLPCESTCDDEITDHEYRGHLWNMSSNSFGKLDLRPKVCTSHSRQRIFLSSA